MVKIFRSRAGQGSILFIVIFAILLFSCNRNYDNPYESKNGTPADQAWTQDSNKDGIADSVQIYFPDCTLSGKECLEKAQANQLEIVHQDSLKAIAAAALKPADSISTPVNGNTSSNSTIIIPNNGNSTIINPIIPTNPIPTNPLSTNLIPVQNILAWDISFRIDASDQDPKMAWEPVNATNKNYSLKSLRPEVVTIVANKLHPVLSGFASVEIKSLDGGKVDTFSVQVKDLIPVTGVFGTNMRMFLWQPDEVPVIVFIPMSASNKKYTLSVDSRFGGLPNVVSIVNGKIHLVGEGNCMVRVTSMDGEFTDDFAVTVIRL